MLKRCAAADAFHCFRFLKEPVIVAVLALTRMWCQARENIEYSWTTMLLWPHTQLILGATEVGHKYTVLSSFKWDLFSRAEAFISFTVSLQSMGSGVPRHNVRSFSDVKNALVWASLNLVGMLEIRREAEYQPMSKSLLLCVPKRLYSTGVTKY